MYQCSIGLLHKRQLIAAVLFLEIPLLILLKGPKEGERETERLKSSAFKAAPAVGLAAGVMTVAIVR